MIGVHVGVEPKFGWGCLEAHFFCVNGNGKSRNAD